MSSILGPGTLGNGQGRYRRSLASLFGWPCSSLPVRSLTEEEVMANITKTRKLIAEAEASESTQAYIASVLGRSEP